MKIKRGLLNNRKLVLIGIILIAVLSFSMLIHALTMEEELNQEEECLNMGLTNKSICLTNKITKMKNGKEIEG